MRKHLPHGKIRGKMWQMWIIWRIGIINNLVKIEINKRWGKKKQKWEEREISRTLSLWTLIILGRNIGNGGNTWISQRTHE